MHGRERHVYGDVGYQGVENRDVTQGISAQWHVALRPGKCKPLPETPQGRLLEQLETIKARIRAKVEHLFHVIKNLFRHCKVRYQGLAKNTAQLYTLFAMANLVLAGRRCADPYRISAS